MRRDKILRRVKKSLLRKFKRKMGLDFPKIDLTKITNFFERQYWTNILDKQKNKPCAYIEGTNIIINTKEMDKQNPEWRVETELREQMHLDERQRKKKKD